MLRFFYTCVMYLAQSFLWLSLLAGSIKASNSRKRLSERYGLYC